MQDPHGLKARVEALRPELIEHLSALCAIPSLKAPALPGMPFGEPLFACLEHTLAICRDMGLDTLNVDGYAGHADYGQQDEILGILGHLDVVPVGTGWDSDPFTPTLRDGMLTARGSSDNKGGTVAALIALKAVMQAGIPLKKRVRLIFGCDEESGWACMNHYFSKIAPPDMGFVPDAGFPVINTEKGILQVRLSAAGSLSGGKLKTLSGGTRVNVVPDEATAEFIVLPEDIDERIADFCHDNAPARIKRTGENALVSYGVPSHGSSPENGVNAVAYLIRLIVSQGLADGQAAEYLSALDQRIGLRLDGGGLNVALSDAHSSPLTMNLGLIRLGSQGLEVHLDIRYPISFTDEHILASINTVLSGSGIEAQRAGGHAPLHVPEDSTLVSTLLKVYADVTGLEPYTVSMGGGTYARSMPNAVAFGASFPDGRSHGAHEVNESVSIDEMVLAATVYAFAIAELCG